MTMRAYSLDAWRRFRGSRDNKDTTRGSPRLADIPADAEMDEGIVLGCWNGKRFVSWDKWRATAPIEREQE
jgi:hypothetical protein